MWIHCFPRTGWTSCYCCSKLFPLDQCEFAIVVRGVGVVIGCDDCVVVGVVGCVCIVDGVGVVVAFTDFADFADVTVIVESGVFIVGLDGVGLSLLGFSAVGVGVVGVVSVVEV